MSRLTPNQINQRQLPLLTAANELVRLTRQGEAPGYAGYGDIAISIPNNLVELYWHGALPAPLTAKLKQLRSRVRIQVNEAPYTWQQLQAQTKQIVGGEGSLAAQGVLVSRVGPLPGATGIEVGIDAARSAPLSRSSGNNVLASGDNVLASARAAMPRMSGGSAPMVVANIPSPRASGSRQHDNSPWWGGSRIVRPGDLHCSTGFSITSGSTHLMLTAGHCGGISTSWQTGDYYGLGTPVGTEINRDPNGDTAIIKVDANQSWIYDKGWDSTVGEYVLGTEAPIRDSLICTNGATSGVRCAIRVDQTGATITFTNSDGSVAFVASNEAHAHSDYLNQQQVIAGGDSGGPVFYNSGTSGQVYATGTISGGSGSRTIGCSNVDTIIAPPACYTDVYYEDITTALSHWGAHLP